jgi:effector-binding domain-containing protein
MMFKIGDFSKLGRVSVKTLRYYDEMGLLKPIEVDRYSSYRYYGLDQLPRLNRILALKDLGFSIEQIAQLLAEGPTVEQMRAMLQVKQEEVERRLAAEQARIRRIEARLRQIEQEGKMPAYEIVTKETQAVLVAAIRSVVPSYGEQGMLWGELMAHLAAQGGQPAGPCLTVYYDPGYRERDVDVEVCQPLSRRIAAGGRVRVVELPGCLMACAIHQGSYERLHEAYQALLPWIEANGYQICGPNREVYLRPGETQDDAGAVTEVQVPIEKAGR